MIRILNIAIEPEQELKAFRGALSNAGSNAGAIASFVGIVRDDGETEALTLSHYPGFTERQIEAFVNQAETKWDLKASLILHRVGRMVAGDAIVLVAAASEHRRDAFQACDYLMDKLKCEAPFWKQETVKGKTKWIEPRIQDRQDLDRWS